MANEPIPQHSPIFGNAEYEAAIDRILQKSSNKIRIFDQVLGKEYNSLRRSEMLRDFLRASRRNSLQIVLHDTRAIDRNCPRILNLLRSYGHAISIHETLPTAKLVYDPFVIVDDRCFVHRFHFDEMRGLAGIDAWLRSHRASFPSRSSGRAGRGRAILRG